MPPSPPLCSTVKSKGLVDECSEVLVTVVSYLLPAQWQAEMEAAKREWRAGRKQAGRAGGQQDTAEQGPTGRAGGAVRDLA